MNWKKLFTVYFVIGFVSGFIWTPEARGETAEVKFVSDPAPSGEVHLRVLLSDSTPLKGYGFVIT